MMDSFSVLEAICKDEEMLPVKIITLKGKDFGIARRDIGEDFDIIAYDMDNKKKAGHAEFFISWTGWFKEFYNIDFIDDKAYNEEFKIKNAYQGMGLSKILLEESINVLKDKYKLHIVKFATTKGRERLKQQFLDKGYIQAVPNSKDYPIVVYKKY
jgi:hypothetical protein